MTNCRGVRDIYCKVRIGRASLRIRHTWVAEGTADYVALGRFAGTLEPRLSPQEAAVKKGYQRGYRPAAAFLLWLERTHDREIVRKLHLAIREKRYSPRLFREACGQPVDALWDDFVQASGGKAR